MTGAGWRVGPRDVGIVVAGLAVDLLGFSMVLAGPDAFPGWVAGYAAAGFVVLLWRRAAPLPVFGLVWLHATVASVAIPSYGPVVGLLIALYTVADLASSRTAAWALAATFVPALYQVVGEVAGAPPEAAAGALAASATFLVSVNAGAWALGRSARGHRERALMQTEQRASEAREAVARERARIARDLHDVVSHSVGVMTLQAAGARRVLEAGKTGRAAQALAAIEAAGTEAMTELRRMLGLLRMPDLDETASAPAPGLRDLPALVRQVQDAGVPACVVTSGEPAELDTGVQLSAFRIVQEALTNVVRHNGAGVPTTIDLRWGRDQLDLVITNDAPATARHSTAGAGYGLIGLRERAAAVGGHLEAHPLPDGGFQVAAVLPARVTKVDA